MGTDKATAAQTFKKLLEELQLNKAESTKVVTDVGKGAPGNADSLEQGEEAGSTVNDIDGKAAEHPDMGLEVDEGEKTTNMAAYPKVKKEKEAAYSERPAGSIAPDLIKQAETLESLSDILLKQASAEFMGDVAVISHVAETESMISTLADELDVDKDVAEIVFTALQNGEISPEDLVAATEQTDKITALAETLDADPVEVYQVALAISKLAEENNMTADEIVENAKNVLEGATQAEIVKTAAAEFERAKHLYKRAVAEKDEFAAAFAKSRMKTCLQVVTGDENVDVDSILKISAAEKNTEAPENDVEVQKNKEKNNGADQIAATMLNEKAPEEDAAMKVIADAGVPEDEIEVVKQVIKDLIKGGVPVEVIEQMLQNELKGQTPDLVKAAASEEAPTDPLVFSHIYLRTMLLDHRLKKAQATK